MTISRLSLSGIRTAFIAAAVAMLSLHPVMSQQRPRRPLPNPPLPITSSHPAPAPGSRPLAPPSNSGPSSSLSSASWTALGPSSLTNDGFNAVSSDLVSGRITGIAVDPTNATTIYVAAAGGGVWKTTDGGTDWTPLTDNQPELAMGAIAVAPSNHLKIYAGTGEANNSGDSNHGEGILVSGDGGSTWTLETGSGAFAGVSIGQIAVDPTNASIAYAAVGGYPDNGVFYANEGIWKTTDGGTTWTNMTAAASLPTDADWSSVVVDPNTPTTIYAAIGDYYSGATNNGIYRSTDSGSTWSLLSNAPHGSDSNLGRIALAVSPAAKSAGAHVLYIVSANAYNYGLGYFERSDNADAATPTFTNLTSGTPDFLGGENNPGQGWYDIAVNIDANGNVYCAGVVDYTTDTTQAIITSSNLGVSWTDITVVNSFEPHSDNHAIAFDSSNNMIVGGDGGIFRYKPGTSASWTDLNGNLNTIQFEGIGLHPTNIGTVIGGSQDNGTELYSDNLVWSQVRGGDGGPAKISQSDGSVCYHEYTGASIERSSDGCNTWSAIYGGIYGSNSYAKTSSNFYVPYTLDPTNGDHLLYGTDYVNESTDGGSSWNPIGIPGSSSFNPSDNDVDSVAISPLNGSNPQVVYATTGGSYSTASQIFVTSNDGSSWTEIDLPSCTQNGDTGTGCRVNQIVADPNDPTGKTAFVVISEFSSGSKGHVFRTANEGGAWTDISANLSNEPVWSIQIDADANKTAYISTDAGVYSSPSPYSTWTPVGTGLPNAQGYDLELSPTLHILGVGTHGRGAWEIETPAHVTNVTSTAANGTYSTGATIPITIAFDTAVTVTGTPHLTLNTSPAATASYVSGSSTNTLTFNYTVGSGQTTSGNATAGHLDYASSSALSLNGGTIEDASSTAAELTLYAPGGAASLSANKSIVISASAAALTSPTPNTVLAGPTVTFTWSAGSGATSYAFWLGTTAGAHDLYASGPITATSVTRTGLPTNGETIYARLITNFGSTSAHSDYTFTAASQSVLTSPTPSTVLAGPTITFQWSTATGAPTSYAFWLGTTAGAHDLYASGPTSATSVTRYGLPTNGETLYARLITNYGSVSLHTDYTFTAATTAALTSPAPSTVLAGPTIAFKWSAASGSPTSYAFWLGTTAGAHDIYASGPTTVTSVTRYSLPTNGETIYARLITNYGSVSLHTDYTYTASTQAALTAPTPGSTFTGSTETFTWSAATGAPASYALWLGTTAGAHDIYASGPTTATTVTRSGLPTNGETIHARLITNYASGAQVYTDYTYTAQ